VISQEGHLSNVVCRHKGAITPFICADKGNYIINGGVVTNPCGRILLLWIRVFVVWSQVVGVVKLDFLMIENYKSVYHLHGGVVGNQSIDKPSFPRRERFRLVVTNQYYLKNSPCNDKSKYHNQYSWNKNSHGSRPKK
jgi:hypothetical protein